MTVVAGDVLIMRILLGMLTMMQDVCQLRPIGLRFS
jgi:hypothetical protein